VSTYWQAVRSRLELSAHDLVTLRNDFYKGDSLDLTLLNLIQDLRSRQIKVGLLSNNSKELDNDLQRLSGTRYFDAIAISYKLGIMKPSAGSYHAVLQMLEVTPQASMFIDDSSQNIQGALRAGLQAIHFLPDLDVRSTLSSMFPQLGL
jgi:putative hydrolase of the HAD superfamily